MLRKPSEHLLPEHGTRHQETGRSAQADPLLPLSRWRFELPTPDTPSIGRMWGHRSLKAVEEGKSNTTSFVQGEAPSPSISATCTNRYLTPLKEGDQPGQTQEATDRRPRQRWGLEAPCPCPGHEAQHMPDRSHPQERATTECFPGHTAPRHDPGNPTTALQAT